MKKSSPELCRFNRPKHVHAEWNPRVIQIYEVRVVFLDLASNVWSKVYEWEQCVMRNSGCTFVYTSVYGVSFS